MKMRSYGWVVFGALALPTLAWANSSFMVKSQASSQNVYKVVGDSPSTETSLAPGIYALTRRSSEARLILPGKISNLSESFNGILAQLDMTARTDREEALAIIDQRLVLFSNRSSAASKKSFLSFGGNTPVLDGLTMRPFVLQPIKDADDVVVQSFGQTSDERSEIILVSIKQPNPMGSGVTFAALVEPTTDNSKDNALTLRTPPLIIDYDFLGKDGLARLRTNCNNSDCVLSRSHLLNLAHDQPGDDRILKRWREILAQLSKQISSSSRSARLLIGQPDPIVADKPFSAPVLDLSAGHVVMKQLPSKILLDKPYRIVQRMDPVGSKSGVFVDVPDTLLRHTNPSERPTISGQVRFEPKSGKYRISDLLRVGRGAKAPDKFFAPTEQENLVYLEVDGRPWVVFPSSNSYKPIISLELTSAPNLPGCAKKAGIHLHSPEKKLGFHSHVLLISFECNKKDKGTYAVLVDETANGVVNIVNVIKFDTPYMDSRELSERVWRWTEGSTEILAFDSVRKVAQSQAQMKNSEVNERSEQERETVNKVPTVPFYDLVNTLRSGPKQIYLTFQTNEKLTDDLYYREYNPQGATTPWTGFYLKRTDDSPTDLRSDRDHMMLAHINGQLLKKPDGTTGKLKPLILTKKIDNDDNKGASVSAIPYMSQGSNSEKFGFNLLIYVRDETSYSRMHRVSTMKTVSVRIPFQNFVGGQIIQGRRSAADEVTLLLYTDGANAGVLAVPLKIATKNEGGTDRWTISPGKDARWIYKGEFNPSGLKNRIIFDSGGVPYWLNEPELDRFDSKFSVRALTRDESEILFVNRPGFRPVLRYDEIFNDTESSYFTGRSFWRLDYPQEVINAYRGFKEFWEQKKAPKSKKNKAELGSLFPEFSGWLEKQTEHQDVKRHEVLLLEADLKDEIMKDLLYQYVEGSDKKWSIDNRSFGLHFAFQNSSPESVSKELDLINRKADRKDILLADLGQILADDELDPPLTIDRSTVAEDESETSNQEEGDKQGRKAKSDEAGTKESEEGAGEKENDRSDTVNGPLFSSRFTAEPEYGDPNTIAQELKGEERTKFQFSRLAYLSLEGSPVHLDAIRAASANPARRIPMVLVATPEQWRKAQATFPREERAGLFKRFEVNAQFLTGSWTLWPPNSTRASDRVKRASKEPISKDEFAIFAELDRLLNSLAEGQERGQQRILVVPEEVKGYIANLITTRWATSSKDLVSPWSYRNSNLALFELNNHKDNVNQELFMDNFESMRGASRSRTAVLLADLGEILRMGRPGSRNEERAFQLRDPILTGQNNSSLIEKSQVTENADGSINESEELDRRINPHAMWLIASEGKKIQPKKSKDWSLKSEVNPEIPLLIIATEKEMEVLKQETTFEARFVDFEKHFAITKLERPSIEAKNRLVQDLFNRPEIQGLGYGFKHESLPEEEARRQLVGLFVGRVDQIARNLNLEPTDAFTRAFVTLKRALTEDTELRRSRMLDRFYLERLYTKVFPLPLNFEVLPKTDFLQKFRDPHAASRGLSEAGYEGAIELKERNARNVAAQTKGVNDNGRKIPSSQIFFGDTSTGKTFLVETTIRYAGLKEYDFDRPNDEEAQALIIKVPEIAPDKQQAKAGQKSIDEVLEHIVNFLALPNGHRGVLLFDDLHKTQSKEVWQKLKTFIEALFEAKDGLITVKRLGEGKGFSKVPVRNLILYMTVNPQDNEKIRNEFVRRGNDDGDLVGEVMAALNKPNYDPIDRSHFARWTDIIDLRKFPRDAKVPTLLKQLRNANAQTYAARTSLVLVTPSTMDEISGGFEDANAREFLSPATYALLDSTQHLARAPIYIVDRQKLMATDGSPEGVRTRRLQALEVESFVRDRTVQYPVTADNNASKLRLLSLMLDNFRGQLHMGLTLAAQGSNRLSGSEELRKNEMLTFLLAVMSNIIEFPTVPLQHVIMRPSDFKLQDIEAVRSLEDDIKRLSVKTKTPFLRIELQGQAEDEDLSLDSFIQGRSSNPTQRKRLDIMTETAAKLERLMEKPFAQFFRISDLRLTTSSRDWIMNMPDEDPKEAFRELTEAMIEIYWQFQASLYDHDLEEIQRSAGYMPMGIYDRARLFLLCMDRAMTRLPWAHVTQYLVNSMELASSDLTLSQRNAFQDFLFKSKTSPFFTVTADSVVSLNQSLPVIKNFPEEKLKNMQTHYEANCENYLSLPGDAKADE